MKFNSREFLKIIVRLNFCSGYCRYFVADCSHANQDDNISESNTLQTKSMDSMKSNQNSKVSKFLKLSSRPQATSTVTSRVSEHKKVAQSEIERLSGQFGGC